MDERQGLRSDRRRLIFAGDARRPFDTARRRRRRQYSFVVHRNFWMSALINLRFDLRCTIPFRFSSKRVEPHRPVDSLPQKAGCQLLWGGMESCGGLAIRPVWRQASRPERYSLPAEALSNRRLAGTATSP
jgi:hypothetical protein